MWIIRRISQEFLILFTQRSQKKQAKYYRSWDTLVNVGDSSMSKARENWGLTLFAPRQPNSKASDWTEATMKLTKIDLDLPPFYEDVEFPSLCEGLYSKNTYILFLSLPHLKIREIFFNKEEFWEVHRRYTTVSLKKPTFSWSNLRIYLELPWSIFSYLHWES